MDKGKVLHDFKTIAKLMRQTYRAFDQLYDDIKEDLSGGKCEDIQCNEDKRGEPGTGHVIKSSH